MHGDPPPEDRAGVPFKRRRSPPGLILPEEAFPDSRAAKPGPCPWGRGRPGEPSRGNGPPYQDKEEAPP